MDGWDTLYNRLPRFFSSAFNANLLAGMLCRLFSVKTKLVRLSSALHFPLCNRDSTFTGVNLPKMFPFVFHNSQSVSVTVTSAVKCGSAKTIANAPPQQ
jgi:hypothetical protein